jgi:hypothetical protein
LEPLTIQYSITSQTIWIFNNIMTASNLFLTAF